MRAAQVKLSLGLSSQMGVTTLLVKPQVLRFFLRFFFAPLLSSDFLMIDEASGCTSLLGGMSDSSEDGDSSVGGAGRALGCLDLVII